MHTCVYTHGHVDHVGGLTAFEEHARVRVVGHRNVRARFDRYRLTRGYNTHINTKQFNTRSEWPDQYRYPDLYYEVCARPSLGPGGLRCLCLIGGHVLRIRSSWTWAGCDSSCTMTGARRTTPRGCGSPRAKVWKALFCASSCPASILTAIAASRVHGRLFHLGITQLRQPAKGAAVPDRVGRGPAQDEPPAARPPPPRPRPADVRPLPQPFPPCPRDPRAGGV